MTSPTHAPPLAMTSPPPAQPTALLLHTLADQCHHDWLLTPPSTGPEARLWTARLLPPSRCWAHLRVFDVEPTFAHRRLYLHYEGPISGGRGSVRRVDEGTVLARTWQKDRVILDVRMHHFSGRLELSPLSSVRWRARIVPPPTASQP